MISFCANDCSIVDLKKSLERVHVQFPQVNQSAISTNYKLSTGNHEHRHCKSECAAQLLDFSIVCCTAKFRVTVKQTCKKKKAKERVVLLLLVILYTAQVILIYATVSMTTCFFRFG